MAFEILNTTWPELAQRTPWGRGICFIDFTIHSPAWSDVYIDGGSASGWEIRVKIQQVLSAWTETCGEWFSVRNESSEPGGASTRTRCHLLLLIPRSGGGQMFGRQTNQPPTKAVLKSEANLTLDKNTQCQFPFTHWSTQAPGPHRHLGPKPQMKMDFGKPKKIVPESHLTTESMQRCKIPISTVDTVRCCSTSAHWGRRTGESSSTIHGWVEKALTAEITPKPCPLWRAEGNPSALVHAVRRQEYQSSRARSDGQRYPSEILGQVALAAAVQSQLSSAPEPGPQQQDGSARIKSIIKQGLQIASRSPITPWSP